MYDNLTLQATAAAGSVAPAAAMPVDPLAIVVDFAVKQRLLTGIPAVDGMWLAYHRALLMGQMQQQAAAASGPLVGMDLTLCLAAAAAASAGPMMPPAVPELAGLFASAPLCGSPAALLGGEMPTPAVVPVPDLNTSTVMAPMSPAASVVSSLASPSSCGSDLGSVTSTEDEGLQSNVSSPASSLYDSCSSLSSSSETEVDHRAHPNAPEHERACLNCHTTSTPLWRRDARGFFNCNACGLYLRTHGKPRPLRRPRQLSEETLAKRQESAMAMQGAKCANCKSSRTTLWRRDENQRLLCNACGLFYKLHGTDRPTAMRRKSGPRQRRKPWEERRVAAVIGSVAQAQAQAASGQQQTTAAPSSPQSAPRPHHQETPPTAPMPSYFTLV